MSARTLNFRLPDPDGKLVWQIHAYCDIHQYSVECIFSAKANTPVRTHGRRWGWELDIDHLFLEVENDELLDEVRDAIMQEEYEWFLRGFVRLSVQRFPRYVRQDRANNMQVGADEMAAF